MWNQAVTEQGAGKPFPGLDDSTVLQNTQILPRDLLHHNAATAGQAVPDIDLGLFNFHWDPNVSTEVAPLGVMDGGMLGGHQVGGIDGPLADNKFFQSHHKMVPNMYPSPASNTRLSPPLPSSPPSSSTGARPNQNQAWIHSLAEINVDLYLQHSALNQSLTRQRNMNNGGGRMSGHHRSSSVGSVNGGSSQFCIGHTFDLMHRFLQLLNEASSNPGGPRVDRGSILLVLSCYHRLNEIYGSFFRSPNLAPTASPELSAHIKHSPFLMGQFELSTSSPLYTSLVASMADFMLTKCRDAVNSLNGGTAIQSVTSSSEYKELGQGVNDASRQNGKTT